ncbi:MAG: hypothetical protein U9O78_02150, partial [Patescibacteria group bacterium]|nr:hypothetical protein [Patescibacteria group bacterium]
DVYSGISTEIERLIIKNHSDNSLSDKHKKQIFSIFNRLYPILGSDLGIISRYFPQVKNGAKLLNQLKKALKE